MLATTAAAAAVAIETVHNEDEDEDETGGTSTSSNVRVVDQRNTTTSSSNTRNSIQKSKAGLGKQKNHLFSFPNFSTASDEEFCSVIQERLRVTEPLISTMYPKLFSMIVIVFLKWRKRFAKSSPKLWNRLFDINKVIKEFVEAVPVLDAVLTMIEDDDNTYLDRTDNGDDTNNKKLRQYTIIDLCSGKGYLGMILSDILPPSKVFRIVLMDKAWPMRNCSKEEIMKSSQRHINWDHIYGTFNTATTNTIDDSPTTSDVDNNDNDVVVCQEIIDGTIGSTNTSATPCSSKFSSSSYYDTWPISIDTSKQNLKSSRQLQKIKEHYLTNENHPVIMLGIHLCGILSLRAIDLYNSSSNIKFFALKPCCLPGMVHSKRKEIFEVGQHSFPAIDVCHHGKWKKNNWIGPSRSHLQPKFMKWSYHLFHGIDCISNSNEGTTTDEDIIIKNDNNNKLTSVTATMAAMAMTTTTKITIGHPLPSSTSTSTCSNNMVQENEPATATSIVTAVSIAQKLHARIEVQHDGGFQNDFLFAERMPISSKKVWNQLNKHKIQ